MLSELTINDSTSICGNCNQELSRKLNTYPQYLIIRKGTDPKNSLI